MLTYNDLYECLRKERYSEQLQPLPANFLAEVNAYLSEKKNIVGKETDLFSDVVLKTKKQFENAISLFKELMLRRRKKTLNLAFVASETGISKRDFENMLEFEKQLFDKIVQGIEQTEKDISCFMEGKKTEIKNKMIAFKQDAEAFLGLDGEKLGPFVKGELANLPAEVASILVSSEKAEFVDEE